jgi:hypothetical protein
MSADVIVMSCCHVVINNLLVNTCLQAAAVILAVRAAFSYGIILLVHFLTYSQCNRISDGNLI